MSEPECPVGYARKDEIALIRLDRPHRLNAVVPALVEGLVRALERAREEDVRAAVLSGRGRAFCAGHDLKEEAERDGIEAARARIDRIQDVTRAIRRSPFPVIAAVHGYALGAGCEFALGCDLVVASADARFGFPETTVGLSVTGGVSRLLTATLGPLKAKELVLLGEQFDAADAARLGLVARVVEPGLHESAALELARALAGKPQFALALAKRALDAGLDSSLEDAFGRETADALLTLAGTEADGGRDAFAAKEEGTR
ncbi:enoyl-CoA hydratase/isomerase family protein [Streptomyces sp. A3M-1-3]|uniref:enoyl-CoA hydratase/isomerase family protein n=1 Tax=Streptomyces sp. A3M-1-3 TaxID=2962044 RepID=UPI0020B6BBA3|nr:enoyl-CoA hydratase/isomerase family protein [Streptomyces sp. A3M-1-3]MCP3818171.1 enoyl-CoA hydratase/isomerase family protein [Streptomyces sp. A3M-1-3]